MPFVFAAAAEQAVFPDLMGCGKRLLIPFDGIVRQFCRTIAFRVCYDYTGSGRKVVLQVWRYDMLWLLEFVAVPVEYLKGLISKSLRFCQNSQALGYCYSLLVFPEAFGVEFFVLLFFVAAETVGKRQADFAIAAHL